jgi:serine/threonine-protein kinase
VTLGPGQTLLHYRVVEKLGEGGMGEVWRAVDTSLDRAVAIKVLPDVFAADPDRLARFEQEARLLASLNHPGIAAVYSVHAHEGMRFLAMELVEGEDLARVLARGPLVQEDAIRVALQIAEALEAAHDSGVIHRDLKPANIVLMPSGKIKVLDFGLAKALVQAGAASDPALSPTMTSAGTMAGMILGTAGYMSPEQARGKPVDRRADLWAFGCILFEMLTGRRAFDGETVSDTLASVLKIDPAWDALPPSTPPAVRRVLRRCLTRDVERRLGHISGARVPLRETLDGVMDTEPAVDRPAAGPEASAWTRRLPWALVALLAVVAGLAQWRAGSDSDAVHEAPLLSLLAPFPPEQAIPGLQMGVVALSPDGKYLALALEQDGEQHLFLRRMDREDMAPIAGTEGASTPTFSPDGKWIAYFADGKLKKVSVDGGKPITLCDSVGDNRGASWGSDDRIVFAAHYTQGLSRVPGSGGELEPLTTLDASVGERTHRWPHAVPGHDLILFTVGAMDSPESYDEARIDALRPSTGERKNVLQGASMARYAPSGHLVFGREGFLFAVPFDVERLETRGSPVPVVENVMGMRSSGVVHADFSGDGLLAYIAGSPRSRQSRLVWRHRDGRTEPLPAPVAGYGSPRLSPDRRRIVVPTAGDATFDVWVWDIERETPTRLTFEGDNPDAVWSPDGERIAFASVRGGARMSTYVKAADGSGAEELLYSPTAESGSGRPATQDWSPDGRTLLYEFSDTKQTNILALDTESLETRVLLSSPAAEGGPALSPDGRWLAYHSDESGHPEVYVRPFPDMSGRWQISDAGGMSPRWSPDGRELFYRYGNSLYAVRITTEDGKFHADRPQALFDDVPAATLNPNFDVLDADTFLLVEPAGDEETSPGVTVVVNWLDDLERRVRE